MLDNVSFRGGNTAIRLGSSFDDPIIDPMTERSSRGSPVRGRGDRSDDLSGRAGGVGLHLVWPSPLPIQMSNVSMMTGIDDGATVRRQWPVRARCPASRQALRAWSAPSYNADNNGVPAQVPVGAGQQRLGRRPGRSRSYYGEAAASVDVTNGRVFLIDGDLGMEINGFALGLPYDDSFMIAVGGGARRRPRSGCAACSDRGRPESDKIADRDGVEVLSGDIVVVEVPVTVPVYRPRTDDLAPPPRLPHHGCADR